MYAFRYIALIIQSIVNYYAKTVYSFAWLIRTRPGKNLRIDFPIQLRGNGTLKMGDRVRVFRDVFIFADGEIALGDDVSIQNRTLLKTGENASLVIGNGTTIESDCSIQSKQNHWNIGDNVSISSGCVVFSREQTNEGCFHLGNRCSISNGTLIDTCGDVSIGDEVAIGHNCTIYTHNHIYCDASKATWRGGVTIGAVSIGDGSWIGSNVTILPNVTIGRRVVIAAGAIVTKDVPDNSVFAGVPAKFIKSTISDA